MERTRRHIVNEQGGFVRGIHHDAFGRRGFQNEMGYTTDGQYGERRHYDE
jgi:hypothetical protein